MAIERTARARPRPAGSAGADARESQAEVLQELGADQAQGYLFGAAEELFDPSDDAA